MDIDGLPAVVFSMAVQHADDISSSDTANEPGDAPASKLQVKEEEHIFTSDDEAEEDEAQAFANVKAEVKVLGERKFKRRRTCSSSGHEKRAAKTSTRHKWRP